MVRTSTLIIELETKVEKMESKPEQTIEAKIEELQKLLVNDNDFESNIQTAVKSLLEPEDFPCKLVSNIVWNPTVYSHLKTLIRLMV